MSNHPPATPRCFTPEDLAALLAGRLPADRLESAAAHLEGCGDCSSRLDALGDTPDPLVDGLRTPPEASYWSNPECDRAVALVEALGRQVTVSAPGPAEPGETGTYQPAPLGQLGQYDLLEKLGEGGMGQVFKARHRLMNQTVAVKVIHRRYLDRPGARERFRREIQALARLDHPHIVRAQYA